MPINLFNTFGYLSIVLWLTMLLLWALHFIRRPRRWLCHVALVVGLLAFICAKINSVTHVNRIQIDRSEQIAEAQARMDAARRKAEKAQADDVAQIRFAEDDANDYLDLAGMEDSDRKYIESFEESATPEWKKEKQQRSGTRRQDDSVEGLLDTSEEQGGMETGTLKDEAAEADPIMMPEADVMMANRLDALNLQLVRWLLLIGVGVVLFDYLRRLNVYQEAYLPLPLPSKLVNGMTPMPPARTRPAKPRRSMPEELKWLIRRGDAFVYLTDGSAAADAVPDTMHRLPYQKGPVDIIRLNDKDEQIEDDFVFETLWFNRASFVVSSENRAEQMLQHFVEKLHGRQATRAEARQTVHVVWDRNKPIPESLCSEMITLARDTGWSVMKNNAR
ncbi:MAG: hypothetical protein R6V56_08535 [Lentisphaeria bacterium]